MFARQVDQRRRRVPPPSSRRISGGRIVVGALVGYLFGTLPSADVAGRLASGGVTDLRSVGSGNPGAANAIAQLGPSWGYAVLVADVAKAGSACAIARRLAGDTAGHVAGTAAVVGHCYPVWNGFKGGKGVAASAGQCLATFPAYTPIDLGVAALSAASPRWKSRAYSATAIASAAWVAAGVIWWRAGWRNGWGPAPTAALPLAAAASSGVILHRFAASASASAAAAPVTADATSTAAGR